MRKIKLISMTIMSCFAGTVAAQQQPGLVCHYGYEDQFLPMQTGDPEDKPIDVKADNVQVPEEGTSVFIGNVDIQRANQQLTAERATYRRLTGDMTASGHVRVRDSDMIVDTTRAEWSTAKDEGRMLEAEYHLREQHARGEASHVLRKGMSTTDLLNATYTTCPEGSNAWQLKASQVHLNHDTAVGEAENVVIRIAGIPVLYTPYINFPLNDERKSGFLLPSLGLSSKNGFDALTPYYFNIAPNLDATFMPRYMSDRGLMLGGQFRYLFNWGEGEFNAHYLNSDSQEKRGDIDNPNYQEARKAFSWQHVSNFAERWQTKVDYNYVSDKNYFRDFGNSLDVSSRTHMNRLLQTTYRGDIWDFTARLQGFQTLENIADPYQRLPQLLLEGYLPDQALGLTYEMDVEYDEFAHRTRVEGQRFSIDPAISLPMGTASFYATPRIQLSHTQYNLRNLRGRDLGRYEKDATRTLPIASFDTGLVFERDMDWGNGDYVQTLEPRAFYLYAPYRDQSDIPVFDTALSTFNMIRLFSYNRFTGKDRIGDANQLSLGVTTRIINEQTGKENLRLTVGQIRYFDDRRVTFPGVDIERDNKSDMVAEAMAYINDEWSVQGEIQWDPSEMISNMSSLGIRYRAENGGVFNIFHRYRRDDTIVNPTLVSTSEQIDVSASLPINDRWNVFGRWYRALDTGETLESLAGFEYNSCCWSARVAYRNYIDAYYVPGYQDFENNERDTAIYFQVELKGLGRLGNDTDSLLHESIRGYGDNN